MLLLYVCLIFYMDVNMIHVNSNKASVISTGTSDMMHSALKKFARQFRQLGSFSFFQVDVRI